MIGDDMAYYFTNFYNMYFGMCCWSVYNDSVMYVLDLHCSMLVSAFPSVFQLLLMYQLTT